MARTGPTGTQTGDMGAWFGPRSVDSKPKAGWHAIRGVTNLARRVLGHVDLWLGYSLHCRSTGSAFSNRVNNSL